MAEPTGNVSTPEDRWILLAPGTARLPERLLLAHCQGKVLFITGAGISRPSGLPDFRGLVLDIYKEVDPETHAVMSALPADACNRGSPPTDTLSAEKRAEVNLFLRREYDVVLGMLERRIDRPGTRKTEVRNTLDRILRTVEDGPGRRASPRPNKNHEAILRLANRGTATTVVTTNFDRLFQEAARKLRLPLRTHTLGAIPRPRDREDFSGVLHIHGALSQDEADTDDLVLTDQDFGEFYLRRRIVADFIYDAARIFHLVLVGYSASDPPMRYLLNAIAADRHHFPDLKPIHVLISMGAPPNAVDLAEWKSRGLTAVPYDSKDNHAMLTETLVRWAELSLMIDGTRKKTNALLKRLISRPCDQASADDRDLFKHLVRRCGPTERRELAGQVSRFNAHIEWLDVILSVEREGSPPI